MELACGDVGIGAMAEVSAIVTVIDNCFKRLTIGEIVPFHA